MNGLIGMAAEPARAARSIEILRVVVALLILIHGVYRLALGGVAPFGAWLETQGFPMGFALAMAVTLFECIGPLLILMRRYVSLIALGHIIVLTLGMVMVHMPFGWFVVGAGRNGMEYSVLLIASLCAVAWAYWPKSGGLLKR
jgi:putative oxidoreductase